jgi:hypothetical protein
MNGGSRYAYSIATKWHNQNGGFYLIGITANDDVDTAGSDAGAVVGIARDANPSTREMVEKIEKILSATPDGERKTRTTQKRCRVPASFQKKKLEEYDRGRDRGAEVHLGLALTRFTAAERSSVPAQLARVHPTQIRRIESAGQDPARQGGPWSNPRAKSLAHGASADGGG